MKKQVGEEEKNKSKKFQTETSHSLLIHYSNFLPTYFIYHSNYCYSNYFNGTVRRVEIFKKH